MNTQLNVEVNGLDQVGSAEKKFSNLKQELKALKTELASGNLSGDAFTKAAARAGELEDAIGDVNQRVKNLASDTRGLDALADAAQGIVGGFTAVQGVMALVTDENEELNKVLIKVQGSMALLTGLQQVMNTLQKESALSTSALGQAWTKLNTTMKATIIGAIVAAFITLVAYADKLSEIFNGVSRAQKDAAEAAQKSVAAEQEKLDALEGQENVLRLQGLSEKEILKLKVQQYNQVILAAEQEIQTQKEILKAQQIAAKRNQDILAGIFNFMAKPLEFLHKQLNNIIALANKIPGVDIGIKFNENLEQANQKLAESFFNTEDQDKIIKDLDKHYAELQNQRAGALLGIQKIDQAAYEKYKQQLEKERQERLKYYEQIAIDALAAHNELQDMLDKARLSDQEYELLQLKKKYDAQKSLLERSLIDTSELTDLYEWQKISIRQKYQNQELSEQEELYDTMLAELDAFQKEEADKRQKEFTDFVAINDAKRSIARDTAAALISAGELITNENFKYTIAGKAIALAQIATDTALAISAAVRAASQSPTSVVGGPVAFAADIVGRVAVIAANVANAKRILNSNSPSASASGSAGGGSLGQSSPSRLTRNQGGQAEQDVNNIKPIKVYVVETDITGKQKTVRDIEINAVIE